MAQATTTTQVLEFGLGGESYCLDIEYIDEIVDAEESTRIPNSPAHVEGVMDLRGRTTSIIDPKTVFGVDGSGPRDRIVVFDPSVTGENGSVGWVVDEVFRVVDVDPDEVDESTVEDDDGVQGIVKRDDRFLVWVDPEFASA